MYMPIWLSEEVGIESFKIHPWSIGSSAHLMQRRRSLGSSHTFDLGWHLIDFNSHLYSVQLQSHGRTSLENFTWPVNPQEMF